MPDPIVFTRDLPTPRQVLAISAHPDDAELQAGATLAKWAAAGAQIDIFVCTDGSKGTWDVSADTAALVERRQHEQHEALRRLGSNGSAHFGPWVDGELASDLDARATVARVIREVQPDVVVGHDPWKRYRLHPDHRHAGLLAVDGIVAARDPHFFPDQGLPHHRPDVLLLFEADEPDHVEGVSGWLDTKIAALEAHESQLESTMFIDGDDDGTQRDAFRERIRSTARHHGALAGVDVGEAFKQMAERNAPSDDPPDPAGGTLLASRDGTGRVHIDDHGAITALVASGPRITLRWSVHAGDGWDDGTETRDQSLHAPAVLVSSHPMSSGGAISARMAVGLVGAEPVVIAEFVNESDYAVALGLRADAALGVVDGVIRCGDAPVALLDLAPRPAPASDDPDVVVPLPHTATLRVVAPLVDPAGFAAGPALADRAVPGVDDINRGWGRHLERGLRIDIGGEQADDVVSAITPLQRMLLSLGPPDTDAWEWFVALCEHGFVDDADTHLSALANEMPAQTVFALGRWAELGGDLVRAEEVLEPLARSAWTLRRTRHPVIVPMGWSVGMLAGAVRCAQAIDQPDVADEIAALTEIDARPAPLAMVADVRAELATASPTWSWADGHTNAHGAHVLRCARHLLVDESPATVDLVPNLPVAWRGEALEAHRVPVGAGDLSWGLRWHGPRPALLWQLERRSEARFEIRVPSISEEWSSHDDSGEALLPDPGWASR